MRFLFGLPFALIFLAMVAFFTGESLPHLTTKALGFVVLGAVSQIGATALMLRVMQARSFAVTTAWIKTEPVIVALCAALVLRDPLTLPALLAILIATAGVILVSLKPGSAVAFFTDFGPAASGLMAAGLFGLSAIGFRGGILGLPSGGFLIRATTTLVLSLIIQSAILLIWMGLFDRPALRGSFAVWRSSLGAGFLGAFASQFWFIGFSLTTAANIRTLALVEVIMAQAVSRYAFRQPITARQTLGMLTIILGVGMLLRSQS